MELNIIRSEKDEIEFEIGSLTIAEILRVYLNKDSAVTFVAWKREHPTKKPIVVVKTKGKTAKKAIDDAVSAITKDLVNLEKDFDKVI